MAGRMRWRKSPAPSGGRGQCLSWPKYPALKRFCGEPICTLRPTDRVTTADVRSRDEVQMNITALQARFMNSLEMNPPESTLPHARKGTIPRLAWVGWLPLVTLLSAAMVFGFSLQPWVFMWALCFALFFGCKWLTWWQNK